MPCLHHIKRRSEPAVLKFLKAEIVDKMTIPALTADGYDFAPETGTFLMAWDAIRNGSQKSNLAADLVEAQVALDKKLADGEKALLQQEVSLLHSGMCFGSVPMF